MQEQGQSQEQGLRRSPERFSLEIVIQACTGWDFRALDVCPGVGSHRVDLMELTPAPPPPPSACRFFFGVCWMPVVHLSLSPPCRQTEVRVFPTRDMENAQVPQQESSNGVSDISSVFHINVRMFTFCSLYCKTVEGLKGVKG